MPVTPASKIEPSTFFLHRFLSALQRSLLICGNGIAVGRLLSRGVLFCEQSELTLATQ